MRHWSVKRLLGGLLAGAAGFLLPVPAQSLDYALVPLGGAECAAQCPHAVYASGPINVREAEAFAAFMRNAMRTRRLARLLIIHSPGGNAYGGIALGTVVRRTGMDVVVARPPEELAYGKTRLQGGICGSACVFVLAGGVKRVVPPGSAVAVHGARQILPDMQERLQGRAASRGGLQALTQRDIIRMFGDYYAKMGISRALATLGEQTPHEQARFLSLPELRRFRLAGSKL